MGDVNLQQMNIPAESLNGIDADALMYCSYKSDKYSRWQRALAEKDGIVQDFYICDIFFNTANKSYLYNLRRWNENNKAWDWLYLINDKVILGTVNE